MKVHILYDKDSCSTEFTCGWGLSYLIDQRILFDTGEKFEYLMANAEKLGLDLERIEKIIISHNHWDHRGGMSPLLAINNSAKLFVTGDLAAEFDKELKKYEVIIGDSPLPVEENFFTSGTFITQYKGKNLQEQSLVVKTEKGVSLFCGCAHPGVLPLVKKAKEIFKTEELFAVIGGFHCLEQDNRYIRWLAQELRRENVGNIGPSHCTGFAAQNIFHEFYPAAFIEIKSGAVIEI